MENKYWKFSSDCEGFLSQIAFDFLELPLEEDIYHYIGEKIGQMVSGSLVFISTYEIDLNVFRIKSVNGDPQKVQSLQENFTNDYLADLAVK